MDNSTAIRRLLEQETALTEKLLSLLHEEFAALSDQDLSNLQTTTQQKIEIITALNAATEKRLSLTPATQTDADPHVDASLLELNQMAEECQQLNQKNGRLIHNKSQQTARLIGLLRHSETPSTYTAHGDSTANAESRSLGKA